MMMAVVREDVVVDGESTTSMGERVEENGKGFYRNAPNLILK